MKDYQKKYLDNIDKDEIRKELNIPDTDNLKKNGGWLRNLFYLVNNVLQKSRVKIQKLQWTTESGKSHYISVWPNFIIKYNSLTTDLIESVSLNVRKGEDIFKFIKDPECFLECEDLLHFGCQRVNKISIDCNYCAILNANYTQVYGTILELSNDNFKFYRYSGIYLLYQTGLVFTGTSINILSYLNQRFKFLR